MEGERKSQVRTSCYRSYTSNMLLRFKNQNCKTKHTSFPKDPRPGCLLLMFCRSRNQGGSSFGQGYCWWTKYCTTLPWMYKTYRQYLSPTVTKLGNVYSSIWQLFFLRLIAWTSTSYGLTQLHKLGRRSCNGTTSSSSTVAHISRCWLLRCDQLRAPCAKFLRRSMKAASRSSKPGMPALGGPMQERDEGTSTRAISTSSKHFSFTFRVAAGTTTHTSWVKNNCSLETNWSGRTFNAGPPESAMPYPDDSGNICGKGVRNSGNLENQ